MYIWLFKYRITIIKSGNYCLFKYWFWNTFISCVWTRPFDIVLEFLTAGVDANFFDFISSLETACESGHLCMSDHWFKKELKLNSCIPLSAACQNGHLAIVLELWKTGTDVNNDKSTYTPLAHACYSGHLDIIGPI